MVLVFIQPEAGQSLSDGLKNADDIAVIVLGNTSSQCPRCGKGYLLPPNETFDIDRTIYKRLQSELNKDTSGQK